MVITAKDLDDALGQILAKTGVTDVKNVLGTYDQTKSAKENLRLLQNHKKDLLLETVNFLKTLGTDYPVHIQQINPKSYYKEDYANDIISFLKFLKPTQCLTCSENYVPTGDDFKENQVKCLMCKRPSHHNCYKGCSVNPDIGIVFLCSECLSERTAKDIEESDKQSPETRGEPSTPKQPTKNSESEDSDTDDDDSDKEPPERKRKKDKNKKDTKKDSDDKDCPLYLKRICPHGLTGKRLVNGKPCPHKHRKYCRYFMEYGPSGCRFKGQCRYLHPRLCENSLKLKTCLNKSCTEFHLKGTQRKPTPNSQELHHQPKDKFIQPWTHHQENLTSEIKTQNSKVDLCQQQPPNSDSSTKDFLERYLHQIKADLINHTQKVIQETVQSSLAHRPLILPQYQAPKDLIQKSPSNQIYQQSVNPPTHQSFV